jgi:hypothetical protein
MYMCRTGKQHGKTMDSIECKFLQTHSSQIRLVLWLFTHLPHTEVTFFVYFILFILSRI